MKSQVGYIVALANHTLTLDLQERLKPEGLTVDQFRIIWCLGEHGSLPMGELATTVLVEPANLTKVIDRMASESLVMRVPDENDRRRVLVTLAPEGEKKLASADAILRAHDVYAREMLSKEFSASLGFLKGEVQTA